MRRREERFGNACTAFSPFPLNPAALWIERRGVEPDIPLANHAAGRLQAAENISVAASASGSGNGVASSRSISNIARISVGSILLSPSRPYHPSFTPMSSLSSTPPPLRPSVVLIAGATGRQGSSIIRALLAHPTPPTKIFALTRTPTSPAGLALAALSPKITLLRGSPTSLPPLAGLNLTAAYLVTEYKSSGPAGELNQATSFLSALVDAKVPHVVVSTVAAPRGSGVAHFESKLDIEEMVRKNGVINGTSWTFLKPVAFMENFPKTSGAATFAGLGLFEAALKGKRIQMVSVEDIGKLEIHSSRQ